jgi:outer membrane receptor protein involved in Fe transport
VTQIDAGELESRGVTRVEDALNVLPQVTPDQTAFISNGSGGTATVNFRGLGAHRSLVLLNGRRLSGTGGSDINQIPAALIDRVEMLTGGASAAYGSDAVTGVVNFITKENFEGVQFDYMFGLYQHENNHSDARAALDDAGFAAPPGSVTDGDTHQFSLLWGYGDGERGNITAYATYRQTEAVLKSRRDYSACSLWADDSGRWECRGSGTIPEGRFADFGLLGRPPLDEAGNPEPPWDTEPWPGGFNFIVEPGTDQFVDWDNNFYNFGPLNHYMRPDERVTLGATGHYEFSDRLGTYFELHYMSYQSDAQIAESGSFLFPYSINCDSPLLSAQQFDLLCGRYNLTADDSQTVFIGRRNVEGGPRRSIFDHESIRVVAGARGAFDSRWSYDVFANYGEYERSNSFINGLSESRMQRALNVVRDPTTGEGVCASALDGTDPDCVPWNVFESGAVTQEAVDYMRLDGAFPQMQKRLQVVGYVSGDLTDYGLALPTADDGLKVVLGFEYRDEELDSEPNEAAQSGDFAGSTREAKPVKGELELAEVFTEAKLPIAVGKRWAEYVALELGYRYSDYSTGTTANTYKFAAEWAITPSVSLRGSLQRAIRAGDLFELFTPTANSFAGTIDSCVGPEPISTFEECQRTGVTAVQYGNIASVGGGERGSVNSIVGGNPDLEPEQADTWSAGFILTPDFLPSLSLSVDYFNIRLEKAIEGPDPRVILDECMRTGLAEFCGKIQRDPATGTLALGDAHVLAINTNVSFFETSGVDINADYSFSVGAGGDIALSLVGTYLDELTYQEHVVSPVVDCAGTLQPFCFRPSYKWASNLRTVWITPWDASVSLTWRYLGDVQDKWPAEFVPTNIPIESRNYFDLSAIWDVTDTVTVRLGVNNLLDAAPPLWLSGDNGNTFGSYDALGRYWFTGLSLRL